MKVKCGNVSNMGYKKLKWNDLNVALNGPLFFFQIIRMSHKKGQVHIVHWFKRCLGPVFIALSGQAIKDYCSQVDTYPFIAQPPVWNLSLIVQFHRQSALMDSLLVRLDQSNSSMKLRHLRSGLIHFFNIPVIFYIMFMLFKNKLFHIYVKQKRIMYIVFHFALKNKCPIWHTFFFIYIFRVCWYAQHCWVFVNS